MKKKIIIPIIFCLLLVPVLVFTVFAKDISIEVELPTGETLITVNNRVYLPSSADITSVKIRLNGENITYGDGVSIADGDTIDLTQFKTQDFYHYDCYKVTFKEGTASTEFVFYKADSLSAVFIDTPPEIGVNDFKLQQMENVDAKVSILNKDGTYEYKDGELDYSEIKVRGNTTPDLYKKPYQIKLENKTDLFGLGEAKTWILLANYLDQSLLRNATMFELAERLGMLAPDFISVDVYIDGCYEGVYLMCEKVQVQSERVNIRDLEKEMKALDEKYGDGETTVVTKGELLDSTYLKEYKYYNTVVAPEDITGGYLIELDNTNKENRHNMEESYFITDSGNFYVMKSPEVCSKEMIEYIATMFSEMEESFSSPDGKNRLGRHYSEYMDVDSFAYGYIMCEFGRTYDAGSNSIYFHKDADKDGQVSKIVKGPLWDCDNSLANIVRGNAHLTDNYWAATRTPWNKLTEQDDFMEVVAEKYATIYDTIYDMTDAGGFIEQEIDAIGSSMYMDRIRNYLNTKDLWPKSTYKGFEGHHTDAESADKGWFNRPQIPESEWAFPTYVIYSDGEDITSDTVIGNLRTHMVARADWLAKEWDIDYLQRVRVDHEYDDATDDTCNECGHVRKIYEHKYDTECDESCACGYVRKDAKPHSGGNATCKTRAKCDVCKQEYGDPASHIGGKATCMTKAVCERCGEVYGDLAIHYYHEEWVGGDTHHWNECTTEGCVSIANKEKHHVAEGEESQHLNECVVCKVWYYDHVYGEEWSGDDLYHWKACIKASNCGSIKNRGRHAYPDEWTVTKEATRSEAGEEERECWCGHKQVRPIDPTGGCKSTEALVSAFISSGILSLGYIVFKKSRRMK
ncbi:MAG: CotH kinase family protein [Clostridia bacterium]|nr:CotH kinase family protein [Clostridia bacterium]